MQAHRISKQTLAFTIVISLVIGGGVSASVLSRRADASTAKLKLIFDPSLLEQHASFTDDYGEMPLPPPPPPPPPGTENPYEPNLEDEYY